MHSATQDQIYTYRITRKVRISGSSLLSIPCLLMGLIFLIFIYWPVGCLLIGLACAVAAKTKYISTCGHCGNQVSHTSLLCPTCRADMAPEPKPWWRLF